MPTEQASNEVSVAALTPDPGVTIPRIALSEQGVVGLRTSNGRILEETQAAFRYPGFISTIREMRNNPTIGAATNVWRMMMSRPEWTVVPPVGASEIDKQRADAVRTMMDDMDHSWGQFIQSVIPYIEYGFGINEIVPRRRLRRNGSKYNDGIVGIKKLPPRSQETIAAWRFDESGSELRYVEQSIQNLENSVKYIRKTDSATGNLKLDVDKLLVFTASGSKNNPEGNSIYKNIYLAHKQLTLLQEQELVGIAKDVQGILKIEIPTKYLDPKASAEDKAAVTAFQNIIDNYNAGKQRGLLVPLMIDPESKQPLFKYELMESKGAAKYDTEKVIKRLQGDIQQALCVDVLALGSEGSGSFSLAEAKTSILSLAIDYRLKEIQEVLNTKLMRFIYEMNGWDCANMAKFDYSDIEEISRDEMGKLIQRVFSTSAIEVDRHVLNKVRWVMDVPPLPEDEPVHVDQLPINLTGVSSRSGDGMAIGTTGDGTSKGGGSGQDRSTNNNENAA